MAFNRILHLAKTPVGGGGSNPPGIFGTDLLSWWKADTGLVKLGGGVPANGDLVASIADNSGNGLTITTPGGSCPVYQTTGLNALPALVYTNSVVGGHSMQTAESAVSLGGKALSVFMVMQMATACANNGRIFCFLGTGDTSDAATTTSAAPLLRNGSSNGILAYRNSNPLASQAISLLTTVHVGMVYDGANTKISPYVNGTKGTDYTGADAGDTFAATGAFCIGGQYTSGYAGNPTFGGDFTLAELITVKAAATPTQVTALEAYFVARGY